MQFDKVKLVSLQGDLALDSVALTTPWDKVAMASEVFTSVKITLDEPAKKTRKKHHNNGGQSGTNTTIRKHASVLTVSYS